MSSTPRLVIRFEQVIVRSKAMYDAPNPSAAGVWDSQHTELNAKRPATGAVRSSGR
jgi:hypothetical protein